jgi:membrane-associated phospholipid phosphatase
MRRPVVAVAALSAALVTAPARGDEPAPVRALAHDTGVDLFVAISATTAWVLTEAFKVGVAPSGCHWCDTRLDAPDASVRSALVWARPGSGQPDIHLADTLSNVTAFGLAPATALGITALAAGHDGRLADLPIDFLIITEATAVTMDLNQGIKFAAARERPYVRFHTDQGLPHDGELSFFSGHTCFTFALAASSGTVATMRGYRWAPWVWAQGMAIAAATGYLRIAADRHYFTDVLTGALVGSMMGFAIPYVFHRPGAAPPRVVVGASAAHDGGMVSLRGGF